MNQVRVQANLESASVEGKSFSAEVEKDFCICELDRYTFRFDRRQIENLETLVEICKGIWEVE